MSRHFKRVATRQAELARKKKHRNPFIPDAPDDEATEGEGAPVATGVTGGEATASAAAGALPEFGARKSARPAAVAARPSSAKPPPINPYFKSDVRLIAMISTLLIVVLIVLAIVIN